MTAEDEEFNRIEMESRIKQEYIRAMNDKPDMDNYIKLMEELSIARMLIRELGDRLAKLEKNND
jgi:replicative DNA helicase